MTKDNEFLHKQLFFFSPEETIENEGMQVKSNYFSITKHDKLKRAHNIGEQVRDFFVKKQNKTYTHNWT